jgi:polysaccharide biosynthesis protein PslH
MKILFIANEVPFPPDNGIRIPSYHAMRLMHAAGHELGLAVLTAETDEVEKRFRSVSTSLCEGRGVLKKLPWRNPFGIQVAAILKHELYFVERYNSTEFRRILNCMIEQFQPDVIHFDVVTMVQYWNVTPSGVGTVASINDSYALTLENAFLAGHYRGLEYVYRKWQYLGARNYERLTYAKFNQVHVMSEIDKEYLQKLNPDLNVAVIPNGAENSLFDLASGTQSKSDIIFVAKLAGPHLNALQNFLTHSWPIVKNRHSNVTLYIVGTIGPDAQKLKEQYNLHSEVKFTGYVEELSAVYRMCGIAIAPINQNCGIVNKVIEAMAAGLAVVGFEKTYSGIPLGKPGVHFVQAMDYESMGHEIADLLNDKIRCDEIKRAGHELARSHYSWSSRKDAYALMYERAAEAARNISDGERREKGVAKQ